MSYSWQPPPGWTWQPPKGYNPYESDKAHGHGSASAGSASAAPATAAPATAATVATPGSTDSYSGSATTPSSTTVSPTTVPTGNNEPTTGSVYSNNTDDAGFGFGAQSAGYTGAQGATALSNVGSPYNSNMLLIDSSQKSQYKYTNTFSNSTDKPETVTLWNKEGADGQPNSGQYLAQPVTFTLQPGQSQTVAFDSGSSVGWAVSKNGTGATNSGLTWGEATFGNGGSGWDISQISPAGSEGNMTVTNDATGSSITNANAYTNQDQSSVGKDQWVTPGTPLDLTTTVT